MRIQPFVVGSGMSAKAIAKALAVIDIVDATIEVSSPVQLKRDQSLGGLADSVENPLLCIGNPHGLHARYVLDAWQAGFEDIVVDKPLCVTIEELQRLKEVTANVAVLHGFRQMWGPQTLRAMLDGGDFGELISIEGRYWQSSAAEIAVAEDPPADKAWKSDVSLNGSHDTFVDLGSHWTDLVLFFAGERPKTARSWLSYANALAPHRDTHAHIYFEFSGFRSMGSISKTMHGAANQLEVTVLGKNQAATWRVQHPDEIEVCRGNQRLSVRRQPARFGSDQPPFHGIGWLEGYVEIIRCFLRRKAGQDAPAVPSLPDCLRVMDVLLSMDSL